MKCNTCGTENVDGARFCASCGAVVASPTAPGAGLVGQVVGGRYNVRRVLGEGGMGVVYEAEQPMGSATRKVALKTLHAHLSHDPSVSQRFHRECGTISQLEHPNTIKVYDFGATADGTLYIAMEFVAGKSLSQVITDSGSLPPDRVLKIMRQIAGSLEEAHRMGIIHRDLKPDNVVLTERAGEKDVVKLLDFGIAARTESADAQREQKLTQQGMVLGTPPYMSPEQFTGKALDPRTDVYSLGVMAYEMLTGRLPFEADTPWQWATEHMTSQPLPFEKTSVSESIPGQMRDAILRSLSKNRDDRQASAQGFYDELAGSTPVPQVAGHVASGTAAMAAPPVFGAAVSGTARTAAMPASGGAAPTPGAMAAPAVVPLAPARGDSGGGKGLLIGLASVGGVLLIGIVVVAARSMKPAADEPLPPPPPTQTAPPATVAPEEPPEPPEVPAEPTATATAAPTADTTPKPVPRPAGKGGAAGTTPASGAGGSAAPTPTGKPAPAGAGGCGACLSAASSMNYAGAASAFASCTDAAQKAACSARVRATAPGAMKAAALNGDCPRAKAIAGAAGQMGVRAAPEVGKFCK